MELNVKNKEQARRIAEVKIADAISVIESEKDQIRAEPILNVLAKKVDRFLFEICQFFCEHILF